MAKARRREPSRPSGPSSSCSSSSSWLSVAVAAAAVAVLAASLVGLHSALDSGSLGYLTQPPNSGNGGNDDHAGASRHQQHLASLHMAQSLLAQGHKEDLEPALQAARESLRKAATLPQEVDARLALSNVLSTLGRHDEVEKQLVALVELHEGAAAAPGGTKQERAVMVFNLAKFYMQQHKPALATIPILRKAITIDPEVPSPLVPHAATAEHRVGMACCNPLTVVKQTLANTRWF
eukprot:m.391003 g.391003  ORF g.391003 m.391003 type:complete len:236 (-) comp20079_c0_seq7:121-828(-)